MQPKLGTIHALFRQAIFFSKKASHALVLSVSRPAAFAFTRPCLTVAGMSLNSPFQAISSDSVTTTVTCPQLKLQRKLP